MNRWLQLILGCVLANAVAGQSLHFDLFSKASGLPTTGVYDITQDHLGHLWIATEDGGLCRFDGRSFTPYRTPQGLPDASVRGLYIDHAGKLWLGLPENGLGWVEGDSVKTVPLPSALKELEVRCMLQNNDGELVVGTLGQGLMQLVGDSLVSIITPDGLDKNVRCALQDSKGRSWWGTDHGVWCLTDGEWQYWGLEHGVPHPRVLCMLEHRDGIWVGVETGLLKLDFDKEQAQLLPAFEGIRIRTLARDLEGELWVGTKTEGVAHFSPQLNPDTPKWLTTEEGLPDNRFRKIFTDRDGSLWFGTRVGGLAALSDRRFNHFSALQGFPEESVTAVAVRGGNEVWFGMLTGDVFRWVDGTLEQIYTSHRGVDEEITCIRPHPGGKVWIGTAFSGVLCWEDGNLTTTHPFSEIGAVQDIVVRADRMLIAGENLTIDLGFTWDDVTKLRPLSSLNTAFFSANSDLWVGTPGGLYHSEWHPETGSYGGLHGIPGTRNIPITSITQSRNGHLWVGTEGSGMLQINDDRAHKHQGLEYLQNFVVHFVAEDANGDLWAGTPDGLQLLKLDPDGKEVLHTEVYDSDDGFEGVEVRRNAAAVDRNGTLWCGTTEGISFIQGSGYLPDYLPPPVFLTSTQLNYTSVAWNAFQSESNTATAFFEAKQNQFSFEVSAVSLTQPEKLKYQFKLEGAENDWQPPTSLPAVTYSSLEPGTYAFLARASVDGERWSQQPALLQFEIAPPFYATWTFRILAILVLGSFVAGLMSLRVRYLKREKRKLEIKVDERTREVQEEKNRSERLLLNILPKATAEELKAHGATQARHYNDVSVLFTDFKGFTQLSEQLNSDVLVETLDRYFRAFDALTEQHGIEKIKTIGDAYMCAAGIPTPAQDHAVRMVEFACDLRQTVMDINVENRKENLPAWDIRIGIHSGPVVAGVVGEKKFAYDIWGDTVNIAARMESSGVVNEINVSRQTQLLIDDVYLTEARGAIAAKNKGELEMYFVREKRNRAHESIHTHRR